MKKRPAFTIQYALLCTFATFLLITVLGKHYQIDSQLIVPCSGAFLGSFLAGWLHSRSKKKAPQFRIGLLALIYTFVSFWLGFFIVRAMSPTAIFQIAILKALADAWQSFLSGILIMVPAFILLVYVVQGKKKTDSEEDNNQPLPPS